MCESLQHRVILDPLGDGLETERVAQIDRSAHDRRGAGIGEHPLNEGAIDLHRIEGQLVQITERAVAGAEIVDRCLDAKLLQRRQYLSGLAGIDHRVGLGDLDPEARGRELVTIEEGTDDVEETGGRREALGTDVHGHERLVACGHPGGAVAHRFIEDPLGHRHDEAGLLCQRDEG